MINKGQLNIKHLLMGILKEFLIIINQFFNYAIRLHTNHHYY